MLDSGGKIFEPFDGKFVYLRCEGRRPLGDESQEGFSFCFAKGCGHRTRRGVKAGSVEEKPRRRLCGGVVSYAEVISRGERSEDERGYKTVFRKRAAPRTVTMERTACEEEEFFMKKGSFLIRSGRSFLL